MMNSIGEMGSPDEDPLHEKCDRSLISEFSTFITMTNNIREMGSPDEDPLHEKCDNSLSY
jgi:hypothetical protein